MLHYLISPHQTPISFFHWSFSNRPTNLQLQHYLYQYGPIAVAFSTSNLQLDSKALFHYKESKKSSPDHAVVIVGYDMYQKKTPFWICKNSWGKMWGIHGFFGIFFEEMELTCFEEGMGIQMFPSCYKNVYCSMESFYTENLSLEIDFERKESFSTIQFDPHTKGYQSFSQSFFSKESPLPLSLSSSLPMPLLYYNQKNPKGFGIIGEILHQGNRPLSWIFASFQMITSALAFHFSKDPTQFIQGSIQLFLQQLVHLPEKCIIYQQKKKIYMKNVLDHTHLQQHGSNFILFQTILQGHFKLNSFTQFYLNGNDRQGFGIFPLDYCPYNESIPLYDPQMCELFIFPSSEQTFPIPITNMNYIDSTQMTYWYIGIFLILLFLCLFSFIFILYRSTSKKKNIRTL